MIKRILLIFISMFLGLNCFSQEISAIYGLVTDTAGYPIGFANVAVQGTKYGTTANRFGEYELQMPLDSTSVVVSCLGFKTIVFKVVLERSKKKKYDFSLPVTYQNIEEIQIRGRADQSGTMQRIDTKTLSALPNVSGNIETMVKSFAGVSSNNELSSQYSVRGGSFDENLVYVNDIEIYRPFLIRSGQQEGLSFVNPDLVGSLKFSAGGYDASYGDKMSSVLDIDYKRPTNNTGSVSASLLGGAVHYEGITDSKRFRYLMGVRYKTSQYLLSGMDIKGEYKPSFIDIQSYLSYDLLPKLEVNFLGNFGQNKYTFFPTDRVTDFGSFQSKFQLAVYYEGQENDLFQNALGALTFNYHTKGDKLSLKLIGSKYFTSEAEKFDILGQYFINEVNRNDQNTKDSTVTLGIGSSLDHARNFLDADINSISHIGTLNLATNKLKWGVTYQQEIISDKMNEWNYMDSAGYALPYYPDSILLLNPRRSKNDLSSNRLMGFVMNTIELSPGDEKIFITAGIRAHYWSLNKQTIFSPRLSISYKPSWNKDVLIYLATGFYSQPAFFKELKNQYGQVNTAVKAQKSIHYVLGADYIFYAFSKPFKVSAEAYYKSFDNLIPYYIDNVRTVYAGKNMAKGYTTGFDFKINGEFVKGAESWLNISIMQSRQDIYNDYYVKDTTFLDKKKTKYILNDTIHPGYFPTPTDQLLNLGLYFQDYLPRYPSYRVHLSLHYGSSLPVSIPMNKRWDEVYRILPSYKRVDLGISKMLKGPETVVRPGSFLSYFKEVWLSAEIFNVIGINNTVSYMWVKTVGSDKTVQVNGEEVSYFAVPNYLTSRRYNIKITASF